MQYGFKPDVIEVGKDYVFGSYGNLGGVVLQPDGQWDAFLPVHEYQKLPSGDPQACVTFATLNVCEILAKRLNNLAINWSDRWLSWNSGTDQSGNSMHRVLETLRHAGVPLQEKWVNVANTFDEWYTTPPPALFRDAINDFTKLFDMKHEYVSTSPAQLKEALKYSPLLVSVSAWFPKDGAYYDAGVPNNHAVVLYGYTDKAWKIFDSYDNSLKLYTFGSSIQQAKRLSLLDQKTINTAFEVLLKHGLLKYFATFVAEFTRRMRGIWAS